MCLLRARGKSAARAAMCDISAAISLATLLAVFSLGGTSLADEKGGGGCWCPPDPRPACLSRDPTNSPGCYKHMNDAELRALLEGVSSRPFDRPQVCGEVVETPEEARRILSTGGCSPCNRFRRDALTAILNMRRSVLVGAGTLGQDGASCFGVSCFRIVMRCGSIFVPDLGTSDPSDAVVATPETPVSLLVEWGNQLCDAASCPSTNNSACGKTIGQLADILNRINASKSRMGECGICRGDQVPPALDCPTGTLEFECQGAGGAPIQYTVLATDNCDPSPVLSLVPPPGTVLPPGAARAVEVTATDLSGNVTSCSFDLRVVDTTPPVLFCPTEPILVDCVPGSGAGGAVVNYPEPVASDACDSNPRVVCNPPSGSFFPFGVTVVTCTATDDWGNAAGCSFEVQVVEQTPVDLVCPSDIVREGAGPDGTQVEYPPPMFSATCNPPEAPSCSPPSGALFPLGSTTVTCSTLDKGGQPVECHFTVTVIDTQPPAINCPQHITVECGSPSGTPVSFVVSATDTCDPSPSVACDPPSGSVFSPGETVVRCAATDSSGNSSTCSFLVTVRDTTPPEVICPQGPVRVDCNVKEGRPGAVASFPDPVALDACDVAPAVSVSHASGSFFPLGKTTVTCTATDDAGNESSCSFEVEVVDATPPLLVCIGDLTVESTGLDGAVVEYPPPVVADECDLAPVVSCEPPSGSVFPMGSTTVTCIAMDQSHNTIQCSFEVTVEDRTPPEIHCPGDLLAECGSPEGTAVEFVVSAADAVDPAPVVTATPASGSLFPPGATVVEVVATDAFGNQSSCRFTVNVVDTQPPRIVCPGDRIVEGQSPGGAPVVYAPSGIDACAGQVDVVCLPPSGTVLPLGKTMVQCIATDPSGNESRCEFQVNVVDSTPPLIMCPEAVTTLECVGGVAIASYPLPTVSDDCDPAVDLVCDPPLGAALHPGQHTVRCTATDDAGNQASCSFVLSVVDSAPPGLNCPQDIVREATSAEGALVEYALPTAVDSCDPTPRLSCLAAPGSIFPLGTTPVTCTADDQSGNMIECSFNVTVVDSTPPVIQCPADVLERCSSGGGAVVNYVVTAADVCDPTPVVACDPPSGSRFPVGETIVLCTAADKSGNKATCSFKVTVTDDEPPTIRCPADFEKACAQDGTVLVEYPAPEVTDACDPAPVVICDPPSGSRLARGAHRVLCRALDQAGNESTCEFTVTVVDTTAPVLVCPGDVTVECQGAGGAVVDYPLPVANDACDGPRPVVSVPAAGTLFPLGRTEVVATSEDASGNKVECTFIVEVRDTTPPEILCPVPMVVEAASSEGAAVDFFVTATDKCGSSATVSTEPAAGSLFPMGQSTVTCRAADALGNSSECTFTVTVVDRTPPRMTCTTQDITVQGSTSGSPPLPHSALRWPPQEGPPVNAITAVVSYPDPVAVDTCQQEPPQVVCSPPSGSRFALGTHTVTARARDMAGNESTCTFQVTVAGLQAFIRGDANLDSRVDIADPVATVSYLFLGTFALRCKDAADVNDDSVLNLADVVYELNYIFRGGPRPEEPFYPLCGTDPTPDALGCERYYPCE